VLRNVTGGKANVRHSGEFSIHGFRHTKASATPLKKRRGCGCFTSLTRAILLVFVVYVVLNPWALHIGGRWTPAMIWHGIGKLQSTSGANYALFIEENLYVRPRRHNTIAGTDNLAGTAKSFVLPREKFIR
jgi:hypothetical protein